MHDLARSERGSATLYVLFTVSVLTFATAVVLRSSQEAYLNTHRAASWEEALPTAESGVDLAIAELRKMASTPGAAWPAPWVATTAANGAVTANRALTLTHGGGGGNRVTMSVSVDSPATLVDAKGWRYYRIRSLGIANLAGPTIAGSERRDLALRKYSLRKDRMTGKFINQPQVTRNVEVVVRPKSAFSVAVLSQTSISFTSANVVIDSYDSMDPLKSTLGQWDPAKRQRNGDVATNGNFISGGEASIFGSLYTNGGSASGISNVTGVVRNDFYQDLQSITEPTWTPLSFISTAATGGNTVLRSSTTQGTQKYKLSSIALNGNGDKITIQGDPRVTTYVEVWVTGDMAVTGNGQIYVDPNVVVTFYASGNVNLQGLGVTNGSNSSDARPGNFLLYGIKPTDGSTKSVTIGGNGNMQSAVYAPDSPIEIKGGGSNGSFSGSVVGKTVFMNGVTTVHYDEALARSGLVTDYRIVSWVEDTR